MLFITYIYYIQNLVYYFLILYHTTEIFWNENPNNKTSRLINNF